MTKITKQARKVFLTVLGTNAYVPCNYYYENESGRDKIENRRYVQVAMLNLFMKDFTNEDRFFFFLTDEAKEKNWEDHPTKAGKIELGLKSILKTGFPKFYDLVQTVTIPSGKSEDEIWKIFEKVYNVLNEKDELIIDVTHGFRSLPMLLIVLINYAKLLKNINLKWILYGAFEVLGPAYKVREMEIKKRDAPIFNLTSLYELQAWTSATNIFINYGNPKELSTLVKEDIKSILKETKGKDAVASELRKLTNNLTVHATNLKTVRGKEIWNGSNIEDIKDSLSTLKNDNTNSIPSAFKPILETIENKINRFTDSPSPENIIAAAKWCLNHNFIQQGITFLQEGIITSILSSSFNETGFNDDNKKIISKEYRSFVSGVHPFIIEKKLDINESLIDKLKEFKFKTTLSVTDQEAILTNPIFKKSYEILNSFSDIRNDINHAGSRGNPAKPHKFIGNHDKPGILEEAINRFEAIFN